MSVITFECTECGEELPLSELSSYSKKVAGVKAAGQALMRLHPRDVICRSCGAVLDETTEELPLFNPVERQYSGVTIDQPTRDWLNLNY